MLDHTTKQRANSKEAPARRLTHRIATVFGTAALALLPLTPAYATDTTPIPLTSSAVTITPSPEPPAQPVPSPTVVPPSPDLSAAPAAPGPPVDSQPPGVSAYLPTNAVITILVIVVAFVLSLRYGAAVAQSTVQGVLRLIRRTPPAP
ncbi:hypothetical protein [Streptomyces sp. PanSC9]|uniref:hypothetical protein n=1 Tax=Streptomyces sp. PanSC9 TaxID=1520461 RepID=UPI000F48C50F|nr:hypothetical protein [Streptomyces sp. PanSC9]ROP44164.1 hypothetical protein EDD94_7946 [Streptomyces sp. PanSC9]